MCGLFGCTRQAYHAALKRGEEVNFGHDLILESVRDIRKDLPKVGVRKLCVMLSEALSSGGIKPGRDGLFDLLRTEDLPVRNKKRTTKTTHSRLGDHEYPNLTIGLKPTSAGRLWVADITYIAVKDDFIYLFLITDAYSRKIIGYCLSESLKTEGCLTALRMAKKQWTPVEGVKLIHHTDGGRQYSSDIYVETLGSDIAISMTENSDPRENAIAERVNGILKGEWLDDMKLIDLKQSLPIVMGVINKYNTLRPHGGCDTLTPEQAHLRTGELKKHRTNYYKVWKEKQAGEKSIEIAKQEMSL